VIILSKDVVLGSLTLTTFDPAYISQTTINGNKTGSCIVIENSTDTTTICGFTLTNGSGHYIGNFCGGGMFIFYAKADISNSVIINNKVNGGGGGIYIHESILNISNISINNNHAYGYGGGMSVSKSTIEFDTIDLSNIYLNYAAKGTDISKGLGDEDLHIVLDTFTVLNLDYYYLYSDFGGIPPDDITWKINAGKIESTNQDLYVSPQGNNNNIGTEPNAPLKDIWFAMLKMESDSLQPDTIHVAQGTYKISTGEKYPLSLKRYASIKGTSMDSCILDAEDDIYHLHGIDHACNYEISNLTLQQGNGYKNIAHGFSSINIRLNQNHCLDHLLIKNNNSRLTTVNINRSNGVSLSNCIITDNIGGTGLDIGKSDSDVYYEPAQFINCIIQRNVPNYSMPPAEGYYGRGMSTFCQLSSLYPFTFHLYNCLISDNHGRTTPYGANIYGSGLGALHSEGVLVNCTFGNNTTDSQLGGSIGAVDGSSLSIYNSVLYGNSPAELYMYYGENELNIYNSLIAGGEEGINIYTGGSTLNYDPSNIDTNPMWDTASMYPYSLSAGSPCIDAGTIDLPPGIELPETDLAGNPRVYNGYVDMGAYEYGPWVGIADHNSKPKTQNPKLLKAFPNPFRFETNISYINPEKGNTLIRVYDLNGRCLKTLMDGHGQSGKGTLKWKGIDNNGNILKAGTYIVAIIVNGKEKDAVKVVKK
jgi:hypothetical protein